MKTATIPSNDMGSYLQDHFHWNAFCTGTTEYQLSYFSAQKLANRFHNEIQRLLGDSGVIDHLIPEQIDHPFVWRKTEQISWRSFQVHT